MAEKIMMRMAVLKAAQSLSLVPTAPPERRHQPGRDLDGQFAVDLVHPKRLVFRPGVDPAPTKADEGIDTAQVTAIEILRVTDYH